jgi:glycosyl-4,4'-diaponeurosporenoate acyltransferase
MRIITLKPLQTVLLDVVAWVIFHLSIGYGSSRIPLKKLNPGKRFFHAYKWEQDGRIYEKLFKVRSWKHLIPNGSALYKNAFSIRRLSDSSPEYLQRWLKESVRSEICHWLMIPPGFLFFLWNNVLVGWLMVLYAFLNNLIPIVLQRYNRPRMRKLLAIAERKQSLELQKETELVYVA